MGSIDNPIKIVSPRPHQSRWPQCVEASKLPPPRGIDRSFLSVLSHRRSATVFSEVSVHDISSWLYFSASCQEIGSPDTNRKRGFASSFGGLQSTHLLLGMSNGTWSLYLPSSHSLAPLENVQEAARDLRAHVMEIFEAPTACIVALVSDTDLAENYYQHPISLQLREAGVLLGHGALVAAALGLQFRILGALGHPWSNRMLGNVDVTLRATGLALLGGSGDDC
jgi:hypothetical protein